MVEWLGVVRKMKQVVNLYNRVVVMAAEQTLNGSKIDVNALETLERDGKATVEKLAVSLENEYGVNPGSTQQIVEVLLSRGYPLSKKTKKGSLALDEKVLTELGLNDILEYRKATKLDSAFVGKLKSLLRPDGFLPHHQNMMGAETGRSTMSDYNWQQVGRIGPVKPILISRFTNGLIGNVDLAQAELRVAAYLSNDYKFAKIFSMADAHTSNAARAFNVPYDQVTKAQRYDSKAVIFRAIYGGSPQNDAQKRVRDYYQSEYKVLWKWLDDTGKLAMRQGYITDPYGKTRNLLKVKDDRGAWAVKRAGVNSPIQGVASHIAMSIMLHCWELFKENKLRSLVLFNVHDSVVFDIHPDEVQEVINCVQTAFVMLYNWPVADFPLYSTLPMTGDFMMGPSWGSIEKENDKWINPQVYACSSAGL